MKSIKVCEYSRSRSFHDDLILQDQASGERSQDQWSSGNNLLMQSQKAYDFETWHEAIMNGALQSLHKSRALPILWQGHLRSPLHLNGENIAEMGKWIEDYLYVLCPRLTQGYTQGHGFEYIIELR